MTGFDPTAPDRDTRQDEPDEVPGNVVPPAELTEDDVPADGGRDDSDGGDGRPVPAG